MKLYLRNVQIQSLTEKVKRNFNCWKEEYFFDCCFGFIFSWCYLLLCWNILNLFIYNFKQQITIYSPAITTLLVTLKFEIALFCAINWMFFRFFFQVSYWFLIVLFILYQLLQCINGFICFISHFQQRSEYFIQYFMECWQLL